jgi:hypothetical protein
MEIDFFCKFRLVKKELDEAVEIVDSKEAFILPVLLEECEIPLLLKDKRYANFSEDPESAYQELVEAINYHWKR